MAVLKCKMCGGDIHVTTEQTYGKCDHCGSTSTLPKAVDEQKANLFNRADHFRRHNDFDKAVTAFENILNIDAFSAEAHWGLVLAKYGIEYVEDPVTHDHIPTCHRVQSDSILTDGDFITAVECVDDEYTKSLYEQEAKRIAEIQKGILSISSKEMPYDVFICYKETTDTGSRTRDSVLAQDVYYQLSNEGYRVFFSRITLEDKLGQKYEPYIFAALNSAKVMVVLGTKPEHFNAVWVKNEWSRFLTMLKRDRNKLLIPCYIDMDAYDLPEELSMLQSQDMSKIGFVQDLIRGIKKVLSASSHKNETATQGTVDAPTLTPGVSQLLDRADMFLEDGEFKDAREYYNRILDLDPRNAKAYFKKLLLGLQMRQDEDILTHDKPLDGYGDYQKAIRFADENYKTTLEGYNRSIIEKLDARIEKLENERIDGIYQKALKLIETASRSTPTCEKYHLANALKLLEDIKGNKNITEAYNQISIRLAQIQEEEEKLKHTKDAEIIRQKECDVILKQLDDERLALEAMNRKLSVFQVAQKKKVEQELIQIYSHIREVKKQYGRLVI